ncbi:MULTISPECIES: hypothetical protein [Vibrio]|nr:hypothetical protein [Vibrio parahaemolyticus]EGQ9239482.1 hypothetical protein [Vibrio vulnificus]EHD1698124.1 hypothetical protein [Vibrio vulnificus]EKZ9225853.1 hypothetical protein [Vibrio vulnificus]ELC9582695.1 hypothetical protein [Vibrio vulnificus]MCU8149768.1 hypothetical protein [Vibrio vulnificus]
MIRKLEIISIIEQKFVYLRNTQKKELMANLKTWLAIAILPKKEVRKYIKFVIELVGTSANYAQTIKTLSDTIDESYPAKYQKPLLKFFYKTVYQRFVSSKNANIFYALEPFLDEKEKMIFQSAPTPLDSLKAIDSTAEADGKLSLMIKVASVSPFAYFIIILIMANVMQEPIFGKFMLLIEKLDKPVPPMIGGIYSFHDFMISTQILYLPLSILLIFFYHYFLPNLYGKPRKIIEKIPLFGVPFSLSRDVNAALFLNSLSLLYKNSINTKRALFIIKESSTRFMKHHLDQMIEIHRITGSDVKSLQNSIFNKEINHILSIFFRVTDPTAHMDKISENIMNALENKVKFIAIAINVIGSITLAAYLTFISLAMMELQGVVQ